MTHCTTVYRPTAEEPTSVAVVRALADAKGVDPLDLDECLYDHVDPDALDNLFGRGEGTLSSRDGRISFTVGDYRVEVEGARKVVVTSLLGERPTAEELTS